MTYTMSHADYEAMREAKRVCFDSLQPLQEQRYTPSERLRAGEELAKLMIRINRATTGSAFRAKSDPAPQLAPDSSAS